MIGELFRAVFLGAPPIAVTSFLLTWWALKHDYFGRITSLKELEQRVKQHTKAVKARKKEDKRRKKGKSSAKSGALDGAAGPGAAEPATDKKFHPAHSKWLAFGGGFYGVVGLVTYAVIECIEIRDFFANFEGIIHFLQEISFELLISLLINSIMNFVAAIAWPFYWITNIHSQHIWLWFFAAYGGYYAGTRFAIHKYAQAAGSVS